MTEKLNKMKLLQFECSEYNFKVYINLEDDYELPEPIKCINCGKKKSIKKRFFNIIVEDYKGYIKKCPTCGRS